MATQKPTRETCTKKALSLSSELLDLSHGMDRIRKMQEAAEKEAPEERKKKLQEVSSIFSAIQLRLGLLRLAVMGELNPGELLTPYNEIDESDAPHDIVLRAWTLGQYIIDCRLRRERSTNHKSRQIRVALDNLRRAMASGAPEGIYNHAHHLERMRSVAENLDCLDYLLAVECSVEVARALHALWMEL